MVYRLLKDRNVPLRQNWWGGTYSTFFCVTNGVRQGSILSPYLFNIYVDDLSVALRSGGS